MTDSIVTMLVTTVKLGCLEFEGLMNQNGEYFVGISQVHTLGLIPPNRSLKQLEALLGLSFQSHQKAKTKLHPKAVNAISILDFEFMLAKLDRSGNIVAQTMRDALIGLSLHQLFCDAFDIEFTKQDRQNWLTARFEGKVSRRKDTDAIEWYMENNEVSDNYKTFIWSNTSDAVNKFVFDKKAKALCEERECKRNKLRDTHDQVSLLRIEKIEEFVSKLVMKKGIEPYEATKQAIEFYQD